MMYVRGFSVDIAKISKISSLNCGLYPFRYGKFFFGSSNSLTSLEFWFTIFQVRVVIQN